MILAGIPVTVYEGQLDLICCTLGAQAWMVSVASPGSGMPYLTAACPTWWVYCQGPGSGFEVQGSPSSIPIWLLHAFSDHGAPRLIAACLASLRHRSPDKFSVRV